MRSPERELHALFEAILVETGQRIGPFELAEQIGAARSTALFRALRPDGLREPREVAIRIAEPPVSPAAAESVRREYEVLRALDDPRIPKIHGFYPGQSALAVSWHDGATLAEVIAAARAGWVELDAVTTLDIAAEIAGALRAAHNVVLQGRPVVHGHLDPSRVRLREDGGLVLVGFGVERPVQWPGYSAPEIIAGDDPGPASDQWSLGAILAEMLLQRRLYEGLPDTAAAAREGTVGPWVTAVESAHPSLGRLLRKMLAASPEDRLPWDGEVVGALLAEGRALGQPSARRAVAAAVLRRRQVASSSPEPALGPTRDEPAERREPPPAVSAVQITPTETPPVLRIEVRPAVPQQRARLYDDEEVPVDEEDDLGDPFPDTPTSPDNFSHLSDVLFSDQTTDPDQRDESAVVREADSDSGLNPARRTAPKGQKPSPLLPAERAGLALASVLAIVAIIFLLSRLMG